jgi:hypothetical protein
MKQRNILLFFLSVLSLSGFSDDASRVPDLDAMWRNGNLNESVRYLSEERGLLKESVMVEQAAAQVQSRSEFGMELRPRVTDNAVGVGFRIYLPDRWSKDRLREKLSLVAQSEQLRVAALEWQELLTVYRDFCFFRMLNKQRDLYVAELEIIEPYLVQADRSVDKNHLAVTDRAKLYSFYLDLMNDHRKVEMERIGIQKRLHLVLGSHANLEIFSETAIIVLSPQFEISELVRQAQSNRADFQRLEVDSRSLAVAEALARSEDGFRLKYIQPEYGMNYDNGNRSWGISASFILPWGTRNPDIAVYQQKQAFATSAMALQRRIMEERLQVLVSTASAFREQIEKNNRLIRPLLEQLESDLKQMGSGLFDQLRDRMEIRERILNTALQSAETECERELLAVDLAKELGTLGE